MKKRFFAFIAIILFLVAGLPAQYVRGNWPFLTAAVSLDASATKTNGTDFTSAELNVTEVQLVLVTMTFTRAAGSASKVNFYFQVSYDDATTWSDYMEPISGAEYIGIATNHDVISGTTVRVSQPFMLSNVTHLRLTKIVNGDGANALTAVNVSMSGYLFE